MILRTAWQTAALLVLAAAAAWATRQWHPQAPPLYLVQESVPPGEISVTAARRLVEEKRILWLDARAASRYAEGHIPGALPVNEQDWQEQMPALLDALQADDGKSTVVIYCDAVRCESSKRLRDKLLELQLGDFPLRILHGGYPAWQATEKK
jgi:rhodanese-related sulfurtransferase